MIYSEKSQAKFSKIGIDLSEFPEQRPVRNYLVPEKIQREYINVSDNQPPVKPASKNGDSGIGSRLSVTQNIHGSLEDSLSSQYA